MLKDAGLDRINHNLNSSRSYYKNICTTHTFEQRVENIRMLQRLGFEICSGGIIGMGESKEDVVDMLLELREIKPEALPINFLLPIPGTPLENADISTLTTSYCMKVLCLARLCAKNAMPRKGHTMHTQCRQSYTPHHLISLSIQPNPNLLYS